MAQSDAPTADQYLDELPPDRRGPIAAVRQAILQNLPPGYEESMQFGMISYVIPLERYPATYNKRPLMYAALASQKSYMSLYLMGIYADREAERWFVEQYEASGRKLNMGKSCVRFKTLADLPLDLIGKSIARTTVDDFIECYEASRSNLRKGRA